MYIAVTTIVEARKASSVSSERILLSRLRQVVTVSDRFLIRIIGVALVPILVAVRLTLALVWSARVFGVT